MSVVAASRSVASMQEQAQAAQQARQVMQEQAVADTQHPPPTRVPIASASAAQTPAGAAPTTNVSALPPPVPQSHHSQAGIGSSSKSSSHAGLPPAAHESHEQESKESNQLATSSRSKYKTYILTNGVFEVERRYHIREIIGQGAYGVVCSALDRKTNSFMAVKKIENVFDHRSLAKRTLRELKLVRTFNHENILGLERVMRPHSSTFSSIYLVSELMETDLACVIRSPQELTDEHVQFFIYQVLRGLKYIHSANVLHRDLKPRNLLVNSNCDLKICDFGLARVDEPENHDRTVMSNYIATRWYRAPEVILGRKRYTKAVDMWSVGCILAELIGRKPIFPGRDSFHQITLIMAVLGTPPHTSAPASAPSSSSSSKSSSSSSSVPPSGPTDDYINNLPRKVRVPFRTLYPRASAAACDLLEKLLCFDPRDRLTVEQALKHPFLAELHCEADEPVCNHMDFTDFYFEYLKLSKEDLRVLIHQEIVNHYREETDLGPMDSPSGAPSGSTSSASGSGAAAGAAGGPLDSFQESMMRNLPAAPAGARKGRRKSF